MREIEVLLPLAVCHDETAMLELASRFARKMILECKRVGHGQDEDMQSYLLLRFIEAVYSYDLSIFLHSTSVNHEPSENAFKKKIKFY